MSALSSSIVVGQLAVNDLIHRLRELSPAAGDAAYWIVECERHPMSDVRRLAAQQALARLTEASEAAQTAKAAA